MVPLSTSNGQSDPIGGERPRAYGLEPVRAKCVRFARPNGLYP